MTALPTRLRDILAALMLALIVTTLTACQTTGSRDAAAAHAGSSGLASTFDAHGGLDRFRAHGEMAYTMRDFPLSPAMARPNRSIVDLVARRNRIEGDGFVVAFDGSNAWSSPGPDAAGLPTRFVTLGSFYFIGMPFVFGDPGVVVTPAGTERFRGRPYRVYRVGYDRGVGYTSNDDYTIFVDPVTDRLALIHHSVTENPEVDRVTWTFDDWQEVDGLLVPARMTFHPGWSPDDAGDGHPFTIENVVFSARRPASSLYTPMADAVIDDRPAVH